MTIYVHNSSPFDPISNQSNPYNFNVILPSVHSFLNIFPWGFPTNVLCMFLVSPSYMSQSTSSFKINCLLNNEWWIQMRKHSLCLCFKFTCLICSSFHKLSMWPFFKNPQCILSKFTEIWILGYVWISQNISTQPSSHTPCSCKHCLATSCHSSHVKLRCQI